MEKKAAKTRTFEEVLGKECILNVLIKNDEMMQRVNGDSHTHQIKRLKEEIVANANSLLNCDEKLGEIMAAAFCEATTYYFICCNGRSGNISVEIPTIEQLYDCVCNTASDIREFELLVYNEKDRNEIFLEDLPLYHHDTYGIVAIEAA